MLRYRVAALLCLCAQLCMAQLTFTYDNAGNRIKRQAATTVPPSGCYTMKLAGNGKFLTNVNGVLKVKAADNTDFQKWKLEPSGSYVKVVAATNNQILGVSGAGNTEGDIITLQTNATQDHLLWTRTEISGSSPAASVFIRKGSSLMFGSTLDWGAGDPSDLVTDVRLANDPSYTFGNNKWILENTGCPANPNAPTISVSSNNYNPVSGTSINLASSCSGDCSGITYTWKLGATTIGTTSNLTVTTPTAPGSYTYSLTATKSGFTYTASVTVNVSAPCYKFKLAGNGKYLTDVNGILKAKASDNTNSQKWKMETSGSYFKVAAADGRILGVEGGGNIEGNLITLQTNGSADHQLWTKTVVAGSNPSANVFIRKGSSLLFGSTLNWGDGDQSDLVTDIRLANDPSHTFGNNKWILEDATCPTPGGRIGVFENDQFTYFNKPDIETSLVVSPNPNSGEFEVSFYVEKNKNGILTVINSEGKRIYQKTYLGVGQHKERINLITVNSGIFIIQLATESGIKTKKISLVR
ncbi:T9SS type A sorting domain-containing protein [Dyadobacter sp. CY345]|uniref:T9SS type A sorting domain-containing protein n=1 Tax=Dyadobacter sp. CY345 TaxID=2909335 RepID=UPI001F16F10A|nr:T9SS type A sorting domain-containing protein [Dyadobacter sp. CY345]MCF2446943.1 T9SS type A sorting domain-containing protein [Dyadobacter sp. CY345]